MSEVPNNPLTSDDVSEHNGEYPAPIVIQPTSSINILSLHEDVFQEILSHLNYDEVARLRLVYCILFHRKWK